MPKFTLGQVFGLHEQVIAFCMMPPVSGLSPDFFRDYLPRIQRLGTMLQQEFGFIGPAGFLRYPRDRELGATSSQVFQELLDWLGQQHRHFATYRLEIMGQE